MTVMIVGPPPWPQQISQILDIASTRIRAAEEAVQQAEPGESDSC